MDTKIIKIILAITFTVLYLPIVFLSSFISPFMEAPKLFWYINISLISSVFGTIHSLVLNKILDSPQELIKWSASFSSGISLIFAVYSYMDIALATLSRQLFSLSSETGSAMSFLTMFSDQGISSVVGFGLSFIFFNIVFIILFLRKPNRNLKPFLYYLIPLLVFTLLYFLMEKIVSVSLFKIPLT